MYRKTNNKNIKIVQLVFLMLGIIIIIAGFYATGPRLAQFVIDYLSDDKVLKEQTVAFLNGLKVKIIFLGAIVILLSLVMRYLVQLINFLMREIESKNLIEKTVSFLGRSMSFFYKTATNKKFLWGFLLFVLIGFSLINVYLSPFGGFHVEGINLQPPKNLARHGIYGTLSIEGFEKYTYRISAGPGILIPNALVFKIFGISVHNSRLLYVLFIIAAVFTFYFLARDIYGKKVALLALFFIIFSSGMFLSPQMGADAYMPALFYLLIGALFWFKSIKTKKNIYLYLCGIFLGLSFQTQWLFLFAIFALVLTCIILRLAKNPLSGKYYVIPISMVILVTLIWTGFRVLNVGLRAEVFHLQQFWTEHGHRGLGEGVTSSFLKIFEPIFLAFTDNIHKINFWEDLQLFLIVPAIVYAIILIAKSKWTDYRSVFILSFIFIWFSWFFFFNYDLAKTHFNIIGLMSQLFVAKLLYDIWEHSSASKEGFLYIIKNNETQKDSIFYSLKIMVICIVLGKVLFPLFTNTAAVYDYNVTLTKPYNEMMNYIKNNTEKNAIFSGWSWSMPWYLDIDKNIDRVNKDRADYPMEQREKVTEYFIVSPEWPLIKTTEKWPSVSEESSWSIKENEKRKKFIEQNCTLLKTFGGPNHIWHLYKVINKNLAQL